MERAAHTITRRSSPGAETHSAGAALLLIDWINDLEFDGGDCLLRHAHAIAKRVVSLKKRAHEAGIPVIYVNDNFGQWQSDFQRVIRHCLHEGVRGEPLAAALEPGPEDYFILKPKHSGFYATALEL